MVYLKHQGKYLKSLLGIIAFVAGIVGFLVTGLLGAAIALGASLLILGGYFLYQDQKVYKWERKAQELSQGLISREYLLWQQQILEILYPDLEIVSVDGKRYPAAILRHERSVDYPFEGLCVLRDLRLPEVVPTKTQKQYVKLLGNTLHAPRMKGFALQMIHYNPDGRTQSFDTITTNQYQNLVTSHILEWELYQLFKSQNGYIPASPDEILAKLPYRAQYHDGRFGSSAIAEPHNAYPLLSVQAIVIYQDTRGVGQPVWRVVLAKRSQDVIVKPGFFQFQPAGGFEVFGSEDDDADFLVRQGFDVGDALLREYAEELFDVTEFRLNPQGRDPRSIRSHQIVRQLVEAVRKNTAWIEFVGTIVDLTVLRHELSFVILIQDNFFCNSELLGSWEAKNMTSPQAENLREILSGGVLHGGSAGLLQLAVGSKRVKELGLGQALRSPG